MSKRKSNFKRAMIKDLPFSPNDIATKSELEQQALLPLLHNYLSWKMRLIPARPRELIIDEELILDERYRNNQQEIDALFCSIKKGDDLKDFLSNLVNRRGYRNLDLFAGDAWTDKDFVLNTKGFHHLHFKKYPDRSNDVIFVKVARTKLHAIFFFTSSL